MLYSVFEALDKALYTSPVLVKELIWDKVEDATTLEDFFLHHINQAVSQKQNNDQLDTQENKEGQLGNP